MEGQVAAARLLAGQQKDVEFRIVPSDDGRWHWEIITRGPLAVQVRHARVDIEELMPNKPSSRSPKGSEAPRITATAHPVL